MSVSTQAAFSVLMNDAIDKLDVDQARKEVINFAREPARPGIWSREFFRDVAGRIRVVDSTLRQIN
jgi:hypothetical protein